MLTDIQSRGHFSQIIPYPTQFIPGSLHPGEEPRTITVTQMTNWWHWIGQRYYGRSERGGKARMAREDLLPNTLLWLDLNKEKKIQRRTFVESILRSTWGSRGVWATAAGMIGRRKHSSAARRPELPSGSGYGTADARRGGSVRRERAAERRAGHPRAGTALTAPPAPAPAPASRAR